MWRRSFPGCSTNSSGSNPEVDQVIEQVLTGLASGQIEGRLS